MKVVFCSNFMNHHQLPLSLEMLENFGEENYKFVATEEIHAERTSMGYEDLNEKYPWIVCAYKNKEEQKLAQKFVDDADVVIIGSAPESLIVQRLSENKLTFRYSERILKRSKLLLFHPNMIRCNYKYHFKNRHKRLYMLCASAFTSYDFLLTGSYINKCFKWGYFPKVEKYDIDALIAQKNQTKSVEILWCGRMLGWKHPEKAVFVAKALKDNNVDFKMTIIGDGEKKDYLKKYIVKHNLLDAVNLLDFMSPEEVRKYMERSDIFLFTSDQNEGWGAVLNEAMNSACCVIASNRIGAVPFLLEDGVNGYIYKNASIKDLIAKTMLACQDKDNRNALGKKAYLTMLEEWNARNACNKFLQLAKALLDDEMPNGKVSTIESGVCSKAPIIRG